MPRGGVRIRDRRFWPIIICSGFLPKSRGASRCFSKMASVRAANFDDVDLSFLHVECRYSISKVVAQICIRSGKFGSSFLMWT